MPWHGDKPKIGNYYIDSKFNLSMKSITQKPYRYGRDRAHLTLLRHLP